MKKTLLALAVLAAAGSVNAAEIVKTDDASVDFYGQLREYATKNAKDTDATLKSSSSRAGINASYKVTDTVKLLGSVEFGLGESNSGDNRKHYIGLTSSEWGTLTVGKQSIISDDVWGVENSYLGNSASMLPEASGFSQEWLQQAMLKYSFETDAGWVQAEYSYDNGDTNPTVAELFVGTKVGSLDIYGGVGYQDDRTNTSTTTQSVVGSEIVSTTTKVKADKELKHGMVTVNYNGDGWNLGTTYWHAELENNSADTKLSSDSIVVAGAYSLTKKLQAYGGYEFVADYAEEGNDYNNVYGGMLYKFGSWARVFAEGGVNNQDAADDDYYYGVGARVYW
ncbi:porin [Vibrio tritonius]|uniref:Porin n=1 Tax=Vibrio tritonius TaxID=1435069 RepID=A0ABS7YNB0_9VIBR|nr:porin [Vibrio tritonius]MCA2015919.1 porin [Vibrio tritonius]